MIKTIPSPTQTAFDHLETYMETVSSSIQINGRLEAVFDLVTTTRYWPQWHPATIGVGGVTERPFTLNDRIREKARIGPRVYEGTWTVVEWERPNGAMLQGESGRIFIRYTFQAVDETTTQFSRQLQFYLEDFAASAADPNKLVQLMHAQSEEALQKLRNLVESLLNL